MGFFKTVFTAPGRACRWLYRDEKRLRRAQGGGLASTGEPDADVDYEEQKREANSFSAWEEIDSFRTNFFFGRWATSRFKGRGDNQFRKDREALERKEAAAEGREYKTPLQRELESAMKKREEKERLKAEKRLQKEERKRRA